MARIVGPNGATAEVEDDAMAASIVGDGSRGYAFAEEAEKPARAPRRAAADK